MQDPILPEKVPPKALNPSSEDIVMVDVDDMYSSDDDSIDSFDALSQADDIPEKSDPPSYSVAVPDPLSQPRPESPSTTRNVLQRTTKVENLPSYNKHSMCVICKTRPAYNDGQRTFPTCGTSCAMKLEAASNLPQSTIMQGHINNPYNTRSGSSSHHPYAAGGAWHTRPSSSRPQIKMCEQHFIGQVCRVRPQCQRGGKIYPTCGLTCAAKLHPAGTVEMCDFCKKRPKAVLNGKTYPQCGRTCRDNAKQALAAAANSATCTTCLICWKAPKHGENNDICSPACKAAASGRAPVLIEVPRGHVAFKKVMDVFAESWKKSKASASSPRIKKIYMIYLKESAIARHKAYRDRTSSPAFFPRKTSETRTWLGISRECGFGDPGNMEPCSSTHCLLCSIIRTSVNKDVFPDGIPTTHILPRAIETASTTRRRASKVVILASAVLGNVAERTELVPPVPPLGYDSVHLYAYSQFGMRVDWGETLVFDVAAINPRYLISFE
ncbi:hypothetical protein GALMADRAFT_138501 [Galerina marginata CBS 339.88]|uniref:Uncharacterized protein n=1 Tax=Galerina marginata (strain CBS 339.88) TaxID=685588 RepID=A0A067TEV0_GALM3|nr:hypothetical protein GALMADRAFT_138501 [Galerina marginata CBS 339.88]